jgi:hypothetical protein
MKQIIVRYKVKQDRIAENVAYIERVFAELARSKPDGIHYASFRHADGRFVHIARLEQSRSLREFPAFQAFVANIADRCEDPPINEEVAEVGSYGMFGR